MIDEQLARCWSECVVKEFWVNLYIMQIQIFFIYILNVGFFAHVCGLHCNVHILVLPCVK